MSIIITGANGQLGSLIIKHLLQKVSADQIIACVRDIEKAKEYQEQGIEVRFCDYDQPESLDLAFAGASKLLLISSSNTDDTVRLRQHVHVIEAAKKSKVEHLLFTSFAFLGVGSIPPSHLYLATEHAILTTGIPHTILRNALYTDFVGVLGLDAAIATGELRTYPGDWSFNTVTRNDLALGIAAVLSEPDHKNKTYELTAPRPWTFNELAIVLSELTGKSVSHRQDPEIQNWIYGFLGKIDTSSTSGDLERLIGGPVTSLKESIKPFIATQIMT
ncbi:NAD(P)-dependent oxidoreductase [Paenibacillus baekrokdamisoli]|uniref:NAD(P)-dependent oxidoreductase n=1 Tax=Paenibacillus baekrokdamisoli TaxID=1712516 RepID=A0A3G9JKH9_9BACL|nr:SDR family oxidoreductase [Paenibacillus baekrokdamisoli]MBB3068738.1 NAD(P)H dehydrogenase (quinone) [Paenibacillus baekrokdamisoli]BBH23569.1 NAD(P)-dependent oxidoreductase [Paenibacillus baekrokdamisoli]